MVFGFVRGSFAAEPLLVLVVFALERTICTLNKIQWLVIVFTINMLGVLGNPARKDVFLDVLHQDLSSKASLSQVEKVYSDFHKEMKAVEAAVRPMPMKVRSPRFSWGVEKTHVLSAKNLQIFLANQQKTSFLKVNLLKNTPNLMKLVYQCAAFFG